MIFDHSANISFKPIDALERCANLCLIYKFNVFDLNRCKIFEIHK